MSEELFQIGPGFATTEPAEDAPPTLLPKSKVKYVKGEDGKMHAEYKTITLMRFQRPAEKQPSRFEGQEDVLSILLVTAGKVKVGENAPRRFSIFDEVPHFLEDAEVQAQVEADEDVAEEDKAEKIRKRLNGKRMDKRRADSLIKEIAPLTIDDLQGEEAEGTLIGVAVGIRRWDGGAKNIVEKYLPADQANAALDDGEEEDGGV